MPQEFVFALILAGWVSIGPILAVLMGRHGRSPTAWGATGTLLGPLAVPIALDALWRRHPETLPVLGTAPSADGGVSVLAGIDGSGEALTALAGAIAIVGDRLNRLTLVHVVTYDAAEDPHHLFQQEQAAARQWMAAAHLAVPGVAVEECLVPGPPAEVLARLAETGGFDLLVVGSRGHGMSPRLFGSVAEALARSSPVPVLVGGQGSGARPDTFRREGRPQKVLAL